MSPIVNISSSAEFSKTLSSSTIVVADFYADWCGPCKAIAPTYESLSTKYSKPNRVTFTKVNVDQQQAVARQYGVTAMPTFMIFRSGSVIETIRGANPQQLTSAIDKAVKLAGPTIGSLYSTPGRTLGSGSGPTQGSSIYRRYNVQKIFDMLIAFFGLYFTTLFSLDAYQAAESSPFNVHRARSEPSGLGARSAQARTTGGASQSGRKLGTIADISGGN